MVYVDDMRAPYGRMTMCHMVADTSAELHAMADAIGVARRWCQHEGTTREHYDVCLSKRAKAVKRGAVEVTRRELAEKVAAWGELLDLVKGTGRWAWLGSVGIHVYPGFNADNDKLHEACCELERRGLVARRVLGEGHEVFV